MAQRKAKLSPKLKRFAAGIVIPTGTQVDAESLKAWEDKKLAAIAQSLRGMRLVCNQHVAAAGDKPSKVQRLRADDAAAAIVAIDALESDLTGKDIGSFVMFHSLRLGSLMATLGFRADEHLAEGLRAKNKAFVDPQLAVGQANREAVLESFARHNRDGRKREVVVKLVMEDTGLSRGKIFKHLAAEKQSSPQR